jgi:hypothetical protein
MAIVLHATVLDPRKWKKYNNRRIGIILSKRKQTGNPEDTKFCWFGVSVVGCIKHLINHNGYKVGDKFFLAVMMPNNDAFKAKSFCQHVAVGGQAPQHLFLKSKPAVTPCVWFVEVELKENGDHKIDIILDYRK